MQTLAAPALALAALAAISGSSALAAPSGASAQTAPASSARCGDAPGLVGTWKLASWEQEFLVDGKLERRKAYGQAPIGYFIFTAGCRIMSVLEADGRQPPKTDADRAALLTSMGAWTGTYRAEKGTWYAKVQVAWQPERRGITQISTFTIVGDELRATTQLHPHPNFRGQVARHQFVLTRAE